MLLSLMKSCLPCLTRQHCQQRTVWALLATRLKASSQLLPILVLFRLCFLVLLFFCDFVKYFWFQIIILSIVIRNHLQQKFKVWMTGYRWLAKSPWTLLPGPGIISPDNLPAHPSTGRLEFHANFGGACSHGLICGCKGSFEPNYKVHLEKYIFPKLDTFQRILVNFMREENYYYILRQGGLVLRVNPYNIIFTNQIKMLICWDKNLRKNSRPTNCISAFSFQKKAIAIETDDKSIFAFHGHFMFYSGTGDFVHNAKEN